MLTPASFCLSHSCSNAAQQQETKWTKTSTVTKFEKHNDDIKSAPPENDKTAVAACRTFAELSFVNGLRRHEVKGKASKPRICLCTGVSCAMKCDT